jgi:tRNA G18 (ribose-2'-O)-methylase SpoU
VLQTIAVDDPDDPRLADYTRLTDISLRTSLEAAHGLFIAEGTKVITRAVQAGYPVRSLLVGESRARDLDALAAGIAGGSGSTVPGYVVPDAVAERLTGYRVHRGALASLRRVELPSVAAVLADTSRVVVLEDLVDHGNVGAIFRCAAALGIDAVILSPRCADPLYRRSVKVSMGAVFAIPYARMTDWYNGLAGIRAAGCAVLALTPDEQATPISIALGKLPAAPRVAPLGGYGGSPPRVAPRGGYGGSPPPGGTAPGHRGGRAFLPLAARGRRGRPDSHEPPRQGRGGGFAQRRRGGRHSLWPPWPSGS